MDAAQTTTVRVKTSTRDRINAYGRDHDQTVDEVIIAGLEALETERRRRRAEYDAARLSRDPDYLADIADVQGLLGA